MSHYRRLGVSASASVAEIQAAYRNQAKKQHPDLARDEADRMRRTQAMVLLNVAYHTLADASRRAHYDLDLRRAELRRRNAVEQASQRTNSFDQQAATMPPSSARPASQTRPARSTNDEEYDGDDWLNRPESDTAAAAVWYLRMAVGHPLGRWATLIALSLGNYLFLVKSTQAIFYTALVVGVLFLFVFPGQRTPLNDLLRAGRLIFIGAIALSHRLATGLIWSQRSARPVSAMLALALGLAGLGGGLLLGRMIGDRLTDGLYGLSPSTALNSSFLGEMGLVLGGLFGLALFIGAISVALALLRPGLPNPPVPLREISRWSLGQALRYFLAGH